MRKSVEKKAAINKILTALASYYDKELSDDVITIYNEFFTNYEIADLKKACSAYIASGKFFPKVAEIFALMDKETPQIESLANREAHNILAMVRRLGYNNQPRWIDPITAHLMQTRYRWQSLCETLTEQDEKWFVKEFVEAYSSLHDTVGGDTTKLLTTTPKELRGIIGGLFESVNDIAKRIEQRPRPVNDSEEIRDEFGDEYSDQEPDKRILLEGEIEPGDEGKSEEYWK
jgi:hypothetical protein